MSKARVVKIAIHTDETEDEDQQVARRVEHALIWGLQTLLAGMVQTHFAFWLLASTHVSKFARLS